jgi:hypothetical protein
MSEMSHMQMEQPQNSISMLPGKGPHGVIEMGGMFTLLKVRTGLTSYADPGWYEHPPGERADLANQAELQRDGIKVPS